MRGKVFTTFAAICALLLTLCVIFSIIIDETMRITQKTYLQKKLRGFKFADSTKESHGLVLIGILSGSENVCLREAQRKLFLPQARSYRPLDIKVFFLIDEHTPALDEEQRINGDIFFLNTTIHGWNKGFGMKFHTWLRYVVENFPDAVLVGRMDDDVFVCTPQIFDRFREVQHELLYYGYPTGYPRDCSADCVDDMFLFIGIELARRVASRNFCDVIREKDCLYDGPGGHVFRHWIRIYEDFVFVDERANDKMIWFYWEYRNQTEYKKYMTGNFCDKYLLFHKASSSDIYRMNQHNGLLRNDKARSNISEIDIINADYCSKYS